jgi:hypothetical protein
MHGSLPQGSFSLMRPFFSFLQCSQRWNDSAGHPRRQFTNGWPLRSNFRQHRICKSSNSDPRISHGQRLREPRSPLGDQGSGTVLWRRGGVAHAHMAVDNFGQARRENAAMDFHVHPRSATYSAPGMYSGCSYEVEEYQREYSYNSSTSSLQGRYPKIASGVIN